MRLTDKICLLTIFGAVDNSSIICFSASCRVSAFTLTLDIVSIITRYLFQ